jgi:CubicO group peptidase (beta-lactamase class C family)
VIVRLFAAAALFVPVAAATPSDGLPVKAPSAVGMSAERLAAIDRVVNRGIKAGGYPGAAVVVGRKGAAVWQKGFGSLKWTTGSSPVSAEETIYDLASVSKVVGTTTAIMVLYDAGKIRLDDPVSRYLPEFSGGLKDQVTVRHLLTHRSGLPAGRDLWRDARTPADARALAIATPVYCRPGTCSEYSDLGADVLGWVAEAAAGQPLDQFLADRVFVPLGMKETGYRPGALLRNRIAPTEVTPPRGYPLQGEVHDENAYALGGVAGHAGLFSTAGDLAVFAQLMLNGGEYNGVRVVSDSTVRLFTRRTAGTRALGWDTCAGNGGCGQYLSERAYGHTGFTGTSLWIDPDREMFVVLLTNRVHAARARRPAKVISDVRADLSDAAALAVMDGPSEVLAMPAYFRADRAVGWNGSERRESARRSRSARGSRSARARAAAKGRAAKRRAAAAKARPAAKGRAAKSKLRTQSGNARERAAATRTASAKRSVAKRGSVVKKKSAAAKKGASAKKSASAASGKRR